MAAPSPQAVARHAPEPSDPAEQWQKYCGFLDLSLDEFMVIQERLLLDQMTAVYAGDLGRRIMGGPRPRTLDEFRAATPFTTYEDYAPYLSADKADLLAEKPAFWAFTSGRSGSPKQVPYTARGFERLSDSAWASVMLSCARRRGDNRMKPGMKTVYNMPPKPYYSGYMIQGLSESGRLRFLPDPAAADAMAFDEKTRQSFKLAMKHGVDLVASQTTVLVRLAESFANQAGTTKLSSALRQPAILARVARGKLRSGLRRRPMLPRDLWKPMSLMCYGMDTPAFRDKLRQYWGAEPYELYGSTETGVAAFQTWNRKGLVFSPFSCFVEFVLERDVQKMRADRSFRPRSWLLNEVRVGEKYELFITNFYGMPFIRYCMEDIFEVISQRDGETGVNLPHFAFAGRTRDIIDIAGFPQLVERDVWQAIVDSGLACEDWTARKETIAGEPVVRIYLELKAPADGIGDPELETRLHAALGKVNWNYRDLDAMMNMKPLKVTRLPAGAFRRYYEARKKEGTDLAHLKPPHMNAPDEAIRLLLG